MLTLLKIQHKKHPLRSHLERHPCPEMHLVKADSSQLSTICMISSRHIASSLKPPPCGELQVLIFRHQVKPTGATAPLKRSSRILSGLIIPLASLLLELMRTCSFLRKIGSDEARWVPLNGYFLMWFKKIRLKVCSSLYRYSDQ